MKIPRNKAIAIALCCIALIAIFFISSDTKHTAVTTYEPAFVSPFATTSIQAKGVYVYAPSSNHVMYQLHADMPLPLASVTKIMTAYVTSTVLSDDDIVTIQASDLAPEGDNGFSPGDRWKFSDLRDVTLVASANDGAEALRRAADEKLARRGASTTVQLMNEKAAELGLRTLTFSSVTGLDDPETLQATAFGSAHDIALVFTSIIHERPDIFEATRESKITRGPLNGAQKVYENTNVTIDEMPSIIASKTGFTDAAGGNLIAAFDAGLGSPIVIAVLGSTNQETRFDDMLELAEKAMRYVNGTYYSGQ